MLNIRFDRLELKKKKVVRYLQTIYGVESFIIPDSILEFQYAQNQITANLTEMKSKNSYKSFSLIVLKISLLNVVLQHFRRFIVR